MIIKLCGMRDAENIKEADALGLDWMGFIFYHRSSRYVESVPDYMPVQAKRVGVFVNEDYDTIIDKVSDFGLHYVQLHGSESPELCRRLRSSDVNVIKAFSVGYTFPADEVVLYEDSCAYFLFDTQTDSYGGSGQQFNWQVLKDYRGDTPFLLSGGIGLSDAEELLRFEHPRLSGIDINSRFETAPALKDITLIKQFLKQIKQ